MMKKASFHTTAAATAAALATLSAYTSNIQFFHQHESAPMEDKSRATAKFDPRFDGLTFIETLVTAHR